MAHDVLFLISMVLLTTIGLVFGFLFLVLVAKFVVWAQYQILGDDMFKG